MLRKEKGEDRRERKEERKRNFFLFFALRPSPFSPRRSGFTFLETLIVVALFSIISVSLFQTMTMGLKVWKLASSPNFADRKATVGMERLTQDLRRVRPYPAINFSGTNIGCQFATIYNDRIYNVTYEFDVEKSCVWRRAESMQEILAEKNETPARQVMTNVKQFILAYYFYNVDEKNFTFNDSWNESVIHLPYAVKVNVELEDGKTLEKVIVLPVSGGDD